MKKGSREILFKNAKLEVEKEIVQSEASRLRKKWNIPSLGFKDSKAYEKWINSLLNTKAYPSVPSSQYSLFLEDIEKTFIPLTRKPSYWRLFFVNYVVRGEVMDKLVYRSGNTPLTPRIKLNNNVLALELAPNTTLNDVRRIWNKVRSVQKTLPGHDSSRTRRRLSEDLELLSKNVGEVYSPNSQPIDAEDVRTPEASHKALQRVKKAIKGH